MAGARVGLMSELDRVGVARIGDRHASWQRTCRELRDILGTYFADISGHLWLWAHSTCERSTIPLAIPRPERCLRPLAAGQLGTSLGVST